MKLHIVIEDERDVITGIGSRFQPPKFESYEVARLDITGDRHLVAASLNALADSLDQGVIGELGADHVL